LKNLPELTAEAIVNSIVDHCLMTTKSCREFMETNPDSQQPIDYKNYPGKMDHTTMLCIRTGKRTIREQEWEQQGQENEAQAQYE
jgi:hypothetical protein